ncbi:MAG TPA: LysR family transcriptional regulator [Phytomonospora sp.]
MDTTFLLAFATVAKTGSFSQAARELGYTQSAVSQQVAALERDLGARLLERRPVAPTEAGRRLLEHAGPILLRLTAARTDVRRIAGALPAELVVGMSPLADTGRLIAAVAAVRAGMPRVEAIVEVTGRADVLAGVAQGRFAVGAVDGFAVEGDPLPVHDTGPFATTVLAEGPVAVAMPHTHPLADRQNLPLETLADAHWIDAPETAAPLSRLRALTRTSGFHPGLRYRGTDVSTLLRLIAADGGLALLPTAALAGVRGVPVAAPLVHRTELVHGSLGETGEALVGVLGVGGRR